MKIPLKAVHMVSICSHVIKSLFKSLRPQESEKNLKKSFQIAAIIQNSSGSLYQTQISFQKFVLNVKVKGNLGKVKRLKHIKLPLSVAKNLQQAALKQNDNERIVQFNARDTTDDGARYLLEKELMIHDVCYKEYIRCLHKDEDGPQDNKKFESNYHAVQSYINENILVKNQAISMLTLHKLYGVGTCSENARSYRAELKKQIMSEHGEQLLFLTIDGKSPQVVVSAKALDDVTVIKDRDQIIKQCAKYLRDDILEYATHYEMPWPLNIDSIEISEKNFPESIRSFFTSVLKPESHTLSDSVKRLVTSYSSVLITAVSAGKVITLKQFLLGVGLHNITGLKAPIRILTHLGHCIGYSLVCEIETSQAEEPMANLNDNNNNDDDSSEESNKEKNKVVTYWWADNYN